MSADITYTDFGVTELKHIKNGDHFMWSGDLYQKIENHWSKAKTFDRLNNEQEPEYHVRNAIQIKDGKAFYFYEEESVVPVMVKIEVSQYLDRGVVSSDEDETSSVQPGKIFTVLNILKSKIVDSYMIL